MPIRYTEGTLTGVRREGADVYNVFDVYHNMLSCPTPFLPHRGPVCRELLWLRRCLPLDKSPSV